MAVNVTSRGYKYRSLPENDTDTFEVFVNDDSKDNMIRLNDELNELNNKVTLDKVAQTNFDFIEGKVVQDGLVGIAIQESIEKSIVFNNIYKNGELYCEFEFFIPNDITDVVYIFGFGPGAHSYTASKKHKGKWIKVTIYRSGSHVECTIGGDTMAVHSGGTLSNTLTLGHYSSVVTTQSNIRNVTCYNRTLTPQEIQHNFSVLNNSQSISQLQTTDSTGKTSILALGSDEDHVEMATGRTLRQEYMGLLKANGKEFTTDGTEKIEVQNGLEARVISAEIKGQTVKNEFYTKPSSSAVLESGILIIRDAEVGLESLFRDPPFSGCINMLKPSTVYSCVVEIHTTNYTGNLVVGVGNTVQIQATSTGLFVGKFTTPSTIYNTTVVSLKNQTVDRVQGKEIRFKFGFYEGDLTINNPVKTPKYGLSSTEAIISNNGTKYPLYRPTGLNEDESRKVILCHKVGDVADTVALKEDGGGIWNAVFSSTVISSDSVFSLYTGGNPITGYTTCTFNIGVFGSSWHQNAIIDKLQYVRNVWDTSYEGFATSDAFNGLLFINLRTTNTRNIEDFKQRLKEIGNLNVVFEMKTPVITTIDKSIMPTIQTNQINILSVDGAVKPSSFKATVPTTGNISKAYDLTLINAYTGVTKANLLKSGDVELLLDVTIPSVFNQQVCSLPTELRPKVETTLLALNGNTPISITILPTGEVKCPTSIVGEIKLKDTYIV